MLAIFACEPDGLGQLALNLLADTADDAVYQHAILATLRPALPAGWLAADGTKPAGRCGRAHWAAGAVPAGDSAGDSTCRKDANWQPALGLLSDMTESTRQRNAIIRSAGKARAGRMHIAS